MTKTREKREKREPDQWDTLLDQLDLRRLAQEEVLGQGGLVKQLTGRLLQKILEAEMTAHLGYDKNSSAGDNSGDSRNGRTETLTSCGRNRISSLKAM
jgi:transposase-like protein